MNHNIITTSSMIQNRDKQYQQRLSAAPATRKHHFLGTLQVLLTAITMLFSVGVSGAWADVYTFDMSKIEGISSTETAISANIELASNEDSNVKITYYFKNDSKDKIKTNGNTFSDDVKWTGYIKTGGSTSSSNNHYLKLTLTSAATVKVYAKGGGSDRCAFITQNLSNIPTFNAAVSPATEGTITSKGEIASAIIGNSSGGTNGIVSGTVQAGDVYIGATNGAYFYAVVVETVSGGDPAPASSEKQLIGAKFSNGFNAFITEPSDGNGKVQVYYMAGTSIPTLTTTSVSAKANASAIVDNKISVTAENGTTAVYDVTFTPVTPHSYIADASEVSFDGTETSWVISSYGWDNAKGWKIAKDVNEASNMRISRGLSRLYLFVDNANGITLINTLVNSDRPLSYSINGSTPTEFTFGKSSGTSNSVKIDLSSVTMPAMIEISSNKSGGDAGISKYSVSVASSSDPDSTPEVIPFNMDAEATTAAAHYPTEWEAGHEVQLPQGLPEFTETNTIYINAATYGASTSSNDNTAAIQAALNAVPAAGGMVVVPAGTWLSGPLTIKSKTVLHLKAGAILKLLPFGTYPSETPGKFDATVEYKKKMFIGGGDATVNDIVIEGEGETSVIDGQGADWWAQVTSSNKFEVRPPLIRFKSGTRHLFRNFKTQNAPGTNITIGDKGGVSHVTVHDVTIKNPSSIQAEVTADHDAAVSHNTDGIPVWGPYVNIYDCNISTGDDNIVFDSDSQYGHVWNCTFGRGHGASFGSYTERVHHIIYEDITFNGTSQGFRIKTNRNDRSGNDAVGTNGAVHDIICRNSTMTGVTEPIILTTHYNSETQDPATVVTAAVAEKTPEYRNFLFQNITATNPGSAYSGWNHARPIYIYGLPEKYIHDITFDNVKITSAKGMYLAYCEDINFINGCNITNTANAENFIDVNYNATVTGNYGQPIERSFVDFKVNFRNETDYQMITPAELPDGVVIDGTFHDGQHGYNTTTITVPVDGPVKFTFGACGSGGNATVKNESNEVIATIDCKSGGCDTSTSFDHIATWIYNSTTPQTLTITTAQYIPFFYAEKCEFIPPVTVTYYDADGTTPVGEPQEMEAGSGLVIKYGESDVHVSSGKKFRNWRVGSASGPKAVDGMSIAENTNLYALATDVEEVGTHYAPNLNNFNAEEHDVIVAVRNCSDGNGHGLNMGGSGEVEFKVAGPTKITLGRCRHANESAKYIIKKASASAGAKSARLLATGTGDELFSTSAYSATDGETVDFDYDGEATNLIITCDAQAYLHSLELTPAAASEPEPETETVTVKLIDFEGKATDYSELPAGVTKEGTTSIGSVKVKNKDYYAIKLNNGYTTDGVYNTNDIKLTVEGGFKAGDVITIGAYFKNSDNTKTAKIDIFTLDGENKATVLFTPESNFANTNDTSVEPSEITYTLTADADVLYIGRNGNTGVNISKILVTREVPVDPSDDPDPDPEPVGDEELFKATATTEYSVPASTTEPASLESYATITGGQMYVISAQGDAKKLVTTSSFAMTNGNTFFKVTLPKALQAKDVITVKIKQNASASRGIWLHEYVEENAYPSGEEGIKIMTVGTGSAFEDCTYKIKAGDYLIGKTEFYIYRATGNGTDFQDFTITRPAPRTFVDFKVNLRTDPYTMIEPAALPTGVSITGSFHDTQHGYNSSTIVIPVDGAVKLTFGACKHGTTTATIKDGTGTVIGTVNCSTDACDSDTSYDKKVVWTYNNETPTTLTITTPSYCPFFYAEACEYLPQVTVTYYDADGTSVIGTDVVNGSTALTYKYNKDDVTVATGKKFRNWKNSEGVVVAEGTTLNADLNLYACVTDIEVATKNSEHTYNLTDSKFLVDEHELISVTNGSFHDGQHGWEFSNGGKVTLSLAGNATITVGNCVYPEHGTTKIVAKNASDETFGECNAVAASDGATYTFIYEGAAGDVTLNITGGQAYIHSIKITHTGDLTLPVWSAEKEAWTFSTKATKELNAQELLYAMSYVNNQTTHDKTLFIPNGTYDLGTAHNTFIPAGMHLIGESQDGVLIKNQPIEESINATATFQIDGAGVTLENMTIKCRAPYMTGDGHNAERGVCIQDCGNGTHYKNVTLDGLQDTYYSNGAAGMKATFDNCIVRGNVDFFCGNGDITVNDSRLQIVTTHGSSGTAIICAPATYTTETQGYQFNNCIVEAATSAVDCLTSGHSSNLKFNLARAWYAGGSSTMGSDRTPRVTFTDTEFEIKQAADWGGSIGYAQAEERRVFNIINTGVQFTDEAKVIDKTNKPFAYATANDRTAPSSVNASNITGGGEYDLETIMEKMEADGGYTAGTPKEISTSNGTKKAIVLKSANTTENGKEKRNAMDQTIIDAINNNDIIVLDGAGYNDFVVKSVMTFRKVENKTVVGINGARLCTEWYLTDYFKSILENVPTSSGTGVNSASTAEGTGGDLYDKDGKLIEHIKEEGEYLTRKNLYEAVGNEDYRYSGIFYLGACKNWIIRNLKLVGPGSLDCAGYDLMAIIDSDSGTKFSDHMWVDHCEFIDGMDGNFDITNGSDFVTVSWCKFYYTDRSYAHQNTNLVGSSDEKGDMDRGKLNITFAYNEWGANCRARMPMARFGRIHMLNNYYNCAGNSEYAMNPRIESEFLVEGNYWERGVRRAYNPNGQTAVTWGNNNYYADNAADKAGSNTGDFTVTVPYQYSSIMLDPHKVPEVITLNGGAKLYQKPYFTTNLGVADNVQEVEPGQEKVAPFQHNAELSEELKKDGLVFSVWAENAHTFQWYKQDIALDGTEGEWAMLEGENRNTYTFKPVTGVEFNLKCQAFGVSGETTSDVLKVKIDGLAAPYYLGGIPTEMQTVYTGSPMTFTANFKDAQGYQWYKNTTEEIVVDDAHKIEDATYNTYTYDPATAEIFYLYCVASNSNGKGDGYSDVVKVKGVFSDVKFHYYGWYDTSISHSAETVVGGTGGSTTFTTTCTTEGTKCHAELNSYTVESTQEKISGLRIYSCADHANYADGTYVLFTLNNALAAGENIKLSAYTGSTSNPGGNYGYYVCTEAVRTDANEVAKVAVTGGSNVLCEAEFEIPEKFAGTTTLYLIPFVGKAGANVTLHELKVYNNVKPADAPTIIVDIDSEYETRVGRELSATIQVEDASAYQWYKNTTNEAVFDEEHKIAGQTSATLSYTTVDSDEGKIYIYCDVTGTKAGSHVTTKVAEVTVLEASNGERGSAKLMWPMVGSDNKNTLVPNAIIVTGDIKNASDVFSKCEDAVLGSMLTNGATKPGKFTDVTEPYAQTIPNTADKDTHLTPGTNASVNQDAYIAYSFTPSVTFKPTNISFKVAVSGTGNGAAQPVLQYGAGASDKKVLADVFIPVRESNNVAQVISSYPISDISIEAGTKATFYIYAGGKIGNDKSFCVRDVIIEGDYVKEVITKCANPTATKGAYDGATQKWTYTLACPTPNSKINYKIGDDEAQLNQNNPVQIALAYGQSFSVWATDTEADLEKKLNDSKTITFTAEAQPALKKPTYTISTYNTATKKFTVEIATEDETTILYTINEGDEQTYSDALQLNPDDVISAWAIRTGYVTSDKVNATMLVPEWPGTEQTLKANGTSNNIGVSYTVGSSWVAGAANNLSDGLKLRTNSKVTKSDASELGNAFRIAVHPGFVIKKIDVTIQSNNESGTHTLDGIFVDEAAESITPSVALPLSLPMTKATPSTTTFTIDNIRAKESIDFAFTDDAVSSKQVNAMFTIYYEFIDDLASVTIDDEPLADDKLATLKSTQTIVLDGEFPEDPVVKMTSVLGYEYKIKPGEVDESNNTIFAKSFYNNDSEDKNYVIKANVNAVKSPNIEIAEDMSLKGGYKVTLKYIEDQEVRTVPYIKIGEGEWVAYDPEKEYFALGTVQSKMKYGAELESETVAREASCPSNSYTAGKPFAVYLYVNGYSDNQVGTQAYNNESFKTDKIYQAIANQFNVIPLAVNNSDAILDKRPDITDAKLVVITETLGGSGSVEIAGVGNKSNMMALTLKRDVLDKTNVLNLKMFLNGSSSANNQRWQWAQPRAMASELTSIMPCTPDGGGMYEIFGNATMSRDASINLWDDINTENMLYHLQPVFNFNEDNESRPNFTPLALVIDPEEPEDQREEYHAIHFYKEGDFQYIGFGLSINEWKQYNENVYAIIDKIGEMIIAGKRLDSKLTGIVKPTITDNGDGSANVFNNNPNADTYYVVYTEDEYNALKDAETGKVIAPAAEDIINNSVAGHTTYKANDTDFHTQKYTEKMHIFAVSILGVDAESEVVPGTVEGNSIRYVIRENDDPAAQGMVAKYPFTVGENFNMPYNQSWKKDGYTVTAWEVVKSSDPARVGTTIKPGDEVSGLTQDITVKAIWTENTHKITDLSSAENKTQRTVTWEFLQSKGAPALAMENKAGNMQAILVGQAKFSDDTFIDVPMTINTDNLATLPDNGTEYHGKFNNTSTNWAKTLTDGDKEYTGSDYAQVRTGTQFTFPMVYGSNVVYKGVELVEAVNGVANGNVNRSQISQSYITDGSKTADALNYWRLSNPGFELDPGWTGEEGNKVLQPNSKIDMTGGVAQLATTSPTYEKFKESMGAMGYDNILYDEDNEHHAIGGNFNYGGLIYYNGEATEATLTSVESAQYVNVGATTGKTLGGLNYGSVFMQSLSVTYPALYDLTCTWNPEYSELDKDEHPGKIEKLNDPRPNCGGRYVLYDDINLKLTPAYGYYVDVDNDEVRSGDVVTKESYYFLMDGNHPGQALNLVGATSKIYRYKDNDPDPEHNANYENYSDEIKANIPEDGAYITMKVQDIDLVVSMKKWPTVKYKVEAYPSTQGYITFNSGNGRPHDDEYEEFPIGKKFYVTAHPNTGYKFKEWRRNTGEGEILVSEEVYDALDNKTGYWALPNESVTFGDGVMVNPFDKNDYLETNELMFIAGTDNHGNNNDFTYVAVFEKAKTGTGYYEFNYALLQTEEGQAHSEMTPIEVTDDDKNQFPSEFTSQLLNFPKCYTLFKPGYTLDHWVEISGKDETVDEKHVFTPGTFDDDVFTPSTEGHYTFGKPYNPGSYYNFETEGEIKHLVPVFKKNPTSYDYRATSVDITWDLRVAERAQRVNFKSGTNGNTAADTKIYYSTHATINGDVLIDVPLTVTLGKKGKLVNDIEEEDKWCAMGEGTTIVIPSGLGAKFTIASLSKMETTTIDGVVPTSYTVEKIDDADVYLYTFTTDSKATSVTLKIGDDYTYYKYIRAELPAADAVPLTVTVNNDAFGTVDIAAARTTADTADNAALLAKINDTKTPIQSRAINSGHQYTLGLGTIVSLHAKRSHFYVLDYFEDGEGNRYSFKAGSLCVTDKDGKDITTTATAVDEYLKMEKVQDFNTVTSHNDIQLTFQVQSYSESMHAVFKENTLYQVNYTSGEEAEGEAPGMTLVEDGESFMIPAENHHLYLDGQTLRYWMDEDGNRYDLGQSYTTNKDLFLTPVFKVNDFTVMNLDATATAKWPLSRKGTASYEGNGDIVINFEGINGIYVTPLKVTDADGNVIDFIDLKMDIRGENGKANNVNSTDRCQINSGTVFGLPSSSNCTFTLNSANSSISTKIDGVTVEGSQTVSSNYTGDKTQIDVQFTGNTYLYEVVAQYKPVTTDLPELDYATIGNISLGALGTPLANVKLSTLKNDGEVSGVTADLSNSTTGIMPVVRGTATRGGYVDVIQATIDNPVATMLVKTRDGVTVSVYKIRFTVTYPNIAPRVTDLKIDRKYQCDLKKMYDNATSDQDVDGTNYINNDAYLKHLGVDSDNAANERVAINGVINIKFSTKMAETTLPAATFQANGTGKALGQAVYALEGQTLTFTYKGLDVNTEYDFIIPAGTFKDVFWAETTDVVKKAKHVYDKDIRLHFTTVETAISTDRRVINYVVTHNQASHFDATAAKMVADGEAVQVASDELIKNLEDAGIPYGTLDHGVELANAYNEAGKRFYIFVPDGEYQLMGNDFVKSVSSPIGEDGKVISALDGKTNVYSGITTVSRDNVSITGQSQENTIVYNHPAFEGLSNASTLKLNGGIANFYAQDMTLQNRFDFLRCRKVSSKGVAPVLWDRSAKPIFKNVKFDSYQDTYYTNANNQFDDTRGYAEDCTIMGYVDFVCGDGDHWFQNCNMVVRQGVGSTATNMFAPRQYDTQKWGYVMNKCIFSAENNTAFDVNNSKMTIARPWANSPAETLIECKYNVLSTDDGYKKMTGGGLIMRMQEYKSYDSNGTILDLSKRSLRNSTPGIGSYDAVMTPSKAAEYNLYNVMGGEDGYDPTLYTAQVNMSKTNGIKQDDTFLTWDDQKQALCYFLFTKDNESDTDWKLFAVTADTEFEMGNEQINKWFCVRAANQRGGLGEPTEAFQYKAHESYKRELIDNAQVIDGWRWSTIYLDFDAKAPVVQHQKMVDGVPAVDANDKPVMEDEIYVYALVKVDATKLTFKRVKTMEKNCGYLIKARPRPEEYEFKYTEKTPLYHNDMTVADYVKYRNEHKEKDSDPDIQMPHMSLMNGSVTDKVAAGTAGYTLTSKISYGLGFYKFVGKTYNANYAWLDAALVAEAQKAMSDGSLDSQAAKEGFMMMVFDDDYVEDDNISTDINGIHEHQSNDDNIYNLSGQRINASQMQRGQIYIINGKKIKK